jgi:hypothetical protein
MRAHVASLLLTALVLAALPFSSAGGRLNALRRLLGAASHDPLGDDAGVCEPYTVASDQRCAYVREHSSACYPEGTYSLAAYLVVHYCHLSGWCVRAAC